LAYKNFVPFFGPPCIGRKRIYVAYCGITYGSFLATLQLLMTSLG